MAKTAYSKAELDEMMAEASAAVELLVKNEVAAFQKTPVTKSENPQSAEDKKAQGGQMVKAGEDPTAALPQGGEMSTPDASASSPAPGASAPPADASASSPAPDASASAPADPAAQAGAPSPEELKSAYDQLSPDEKKMHLEALQASMAMDQSAGAPPAGPAAPMPGPDATAPMPADQSQGVNPEFAMKSEQMEKEIEGLKKNLGLAVEALTLVIGQPKVKSIQAEDVVLKNEPAFQVQGLTKSQITERLNKAIRGGRLEKSDGELIKGFYNGQKQVADIAHLLK